MSAEGQYDRTFLSYSRADERLVFRFAEDLRDRGVVIWVDQLNIRTSEHWDRAVERAIHDCHAMVVFLSPRAVVSDNVADEISLALECGKAIIPVMIETCRLPLRLTRMHVIDATSGYDAALGQCLAAIKGANACAVTAANANVADEPDLLRTVTEQLASAIGPIAELLVDQAATRARSAEDLYGMLSLHIDDDSERERFLGWRIVPREVDAEASGTIAPGEVHRVANLLTRYLGPIAPIVTRRESITARSLSDLLRRVAESIRSEQDRDAFCRQVACAQSSSSS
ncbi:MAG: toll/interleukin-1 receptor domain-containing protein [Sphingomicrobium sp.]